MKIIFGFALNIDNVNSAVNLFLASDKYFI